MDGPTLWVIRCRLDLIHLQNYRGRGNGYVAAYSDRAAAEARRDELERAARVARRSESIFSSSRRPGVRSDGEWVPPDWGELSSLPEPVFCDWLIEGGVEPPDPCIMPVNGRDRMEAWCAWFRYSMREWSDAEFERFWLSMDRWRFYDVYEVPLTPRPGRPSRRRGERA